MTESLRLPYKSWSWLDAGQLDADTMRKGPSSSRLGVVGDHFDRMG